MPYVQALCAYAVQKGILEDSPFAHEQFSAHIMNLLTPLPSQVISAFESLYTKSPKDATDWFYAFCKTNNSIRVDEVAKNIAFQEESPYGTLEITINLSKPEKDPKEIAKLRDIPASGYPACMLCLENEGFAGHPGYPSHETLRTIPIRPLGERWRLQYSPYTYYPEHCIALNEKHIPMKIDHHTFDLLLALTDIFPHYFFGSNADLPIVGGSILNHEHFQGGQHVFPMDTAKPYAQCKHSAFPQVRVQLVHWPMTCIRLLCPDKKALSAAAEHLLASWRTYSSPAHDILHETAGEPHNTITPIARALQNGQYMLQLVLRNNRTTDAHPLGIFHPHADLHHIKRENIGLIEVMGLFILPGRLRLELSKLEGYMTGNRLLGHMDPEDTIAKHSRWLGELMQTYGTMLSGHEAQSTLRKELANRCVRVLEDAGVYKLSDEGKQGLQTFLQSAGFSQYQPL